MQAARLTKSSFAGAYVPELLSIYKVHICPTLETPINRQMTAGNKTSADTKLSRINNLFSTIRVHGVF